MRAAVHNLGCKVNSYELDIMAQELERAGWELVPFDQVAEVYIVNTCTVTGIADRKSRQMLHRARRTNPDALVVAAGCYVETDRDRLRADPLVDLCVDNRDKVNIASILAERFSERSGELLAQQTADAPVKLERPLRTRADVKIQDGCNQFCTYCIIPYARGRIRSRDPEQIVLEVKGLAAGGVSETVLTGIHLSSYGKDLHSPGTSGDRGPGRGSSAETKADTAGRDCSGRELLQLLTRLQMTAGLRRIRLGSLEPGIITGEFVDGLARLSKICPHFHLSLQSGCDMTLRRMNRHYTTADYRNSVRLLRNAYDRPAITTDIIVGFPGETQEEFRQTLAFAEEMGFYQIHVFKYSPRKGTPAAGFPDQCSDQVKSARSHALLELTRRQAQDYRDSFLGQKEEILLEETVEVGGETFYAGHTMRYLEVLADGQGHCSGEFVSGILSPGPENTPYLMLREEQRAPL